MRDIIIPKSRLPAENAADTEFTRFAAIPPLFTMNTIDNIT